MAPIAGGFITQTVGSKYIFIAMAALCGLASIIGIPLLRETYGPVVRARHYGKPVDPEKISSKITGGAEQKFEFLWLAMSRPVVLLCRSSICFLMSLFMAYIAG